MNRKVSIIANSFSATFVFRRSLLRGLKAEGKLGPVVSSSDDLSNVDLGGLDIDLVVIDLMTVISMIKSLYKISRQLKSSNVNIIHGFTHVGNFLAWLTSSINSSKLILTVTGMGKAFSSNSIYNRVLQTVILAFYWVARFKTSAIIVQNKDDFLLFSRLLGRNSRKKLFITNGSGIDLSYFDGVQPYILPNRSLGSITIGFFSRALPQKGVKEFYELASSYSSVGSFRFVHVGHPGYGEYAPDGIKSTASQMNVEYYDFAVDIRPFLLATDIVIIPSAYREGLSRLFIEAMLAGKVVVARDTTGVRDHIKSDDNAVLYRNNLKGALEHAFTMNLGEIGKRARLYAENNFDVKIVDGVYRKAYGLTHDK